MAKKFFSVLKNNIECAFCKEHECPIKYEPDHSKRDGELWIRCKKEQEKKLKKAFK